MEKNVIVVAARNKSGLLQSSANISWTVLHEFGHFFGLMHTSLTQFDYIRTYDQSVVEDGIWDTDTCSGLVEKIRALQKTSFNQQGIVQKNLSLIPH